MSGMVMHRCRSGRGPDPSISSGSPKRGTARRRGTPSRRRSRPPGVEREHARSRAAPRGRPPRVARERQLAVRATRARPPAPGARQRARGEERADRLAAAVPLGRGGIANVASSASIATIAVDVAGLPRRDVALDDGAQPLVAERRAASPAGCARAAARSTAAARALERAVDRGGRGVERLRRSPPARSRARRAAAAPRAGAPAGAAARRRRRARRSRAARSGPRARPAAEPASGYGSSQTVSRRASAACGPRRPGVDRQHAASGAARSSAGRRWWRSGTARSAASCGPRSAAGRATRAASASCRASSASCSGAEHPVAVGLQRGAVRRDQALERLAVGPAGGAVWGARIGFTPAKTPGGPESIARRTDGRRRARPEAFPAPAGRGTPGGMGSSDRIERVAREAFGFDELRPGQREAIEAVLAGPRHARGHVDGLGQVRHLPDRRAADARARPSWSRR